MAKHHIEQGTDGPEIASTGEFYAQCFCFEGAYLMGRVDTMFAFRSTMEPFLTLTLVTAVIVHTFASISHPQSAFLLRALKAIIFGVFVWCNTPTKALSEAQRLLLKCIPRDIRTALRILHLEPEIMRYACCPKCFALYLPSEDPGRSDDPYPHTCSHTPPGGEPCGTTLVVEERLAPKHKGEPHRRVFRPIRVFPYHTLSSWLKVFLSRPEIEKVLMTSWDNTSADGIWRDIKDSPVFREFRAPGNKTRFFVQQQGSLHLVFSLFVDWFNPYGNKKAGKSHSMGVICMACLNLPIEIRYAPENIYLAGVIPGPREPDMDQLNHLLAPLVDESYKFWTRGLYVTRTALRWVGRFVRIAMIPLVCDLPAMRKAAGFAGHGSKRHFCSYCALLKSDINNIDWETWPEPLSWDAHHDIAFAYRDGDANERTAIFETHGIRWSELMRLPYWDPTRFAIVDVMHNLFLGDLRHHCMEVWGIYIKDKAPSGKKVQSHSPEDQKNNLDKAMKGLLKGSFQALDHLRKGYIVAIAKINEVPPREGVLTKAGYINGLLDWVSVLTIVTEITIRLHDCR